MLHAAKVRLPETRGGEVVRIAIYAGVLREQALHVEGRCLGARFLLSQCGHDGDNGDQCHDHSEHAPIRCDFSYARPYLDSAARSGPEVARVWP